MACPIYEALYEGNRGNGKTDTLIMSFGKHVGAGWGSDWRGVLFRQSYKELEDVMQKTKQWFPLIWPEAQYNEQKSYWHWPSGERLYFRHAMRADDYWHHHGHNYPWIGWEELTTWADPGIYLAMMSICRSSRKGIPLMYRATCNPYGPGHSWVKARWRLPVPPGNTVGPLINDSLARDGTFEPPRVAIHGHLEENKVLLNADPKYIDRLSAAARNPAQLRAWKHGDWNIVSGGMIDDVWDEKIHVVPEFQIPSSWRIDRAFDWGSSKPFAVGWFAESDGCPVRLRDGRTIGQVRGDVVLVKEWYGWNGHPNEGTQMLAREIARGIVEREVRWGWRNEQRSRVRPGPADTSIFNVENGVCIADDMSEPVKLENGQTFKGVDWEAADKRPGSRIQGWEQMRKVLKAALPNPMGVPREEPAFFVVNTCNDGFLRTVPSLPRDKKDPDDADSDAEDHTADMCRYRIRQMGYAATQGKVVGMW